MTRAYVSLFRAILNLKGGVEGTPFAGGVALKYAGRMNADAYELGARVVRSGEVWHRWPALVWDHMDRRLVA